MPDGPGIAILPVTRPAVVELIQADGESVRLPGDRPRPELTMWLRRVPPEGDESGDVLVYRRFETEMPTDPTSGMLLDLVDVIVPEGALSVDVRPGCFIQIITMTSTPELLPELLRVNTAATREMFRDKPGFVGIVLHRGPTSAGRPNVQVELVVWRSEADFRAATAGSEHRAHVAEDERLTVAIDMRRYELSSEPG